MGSMKGTSAGTALMTAYNRLNGNIKLPNQIVHELINSGLWNGQNVKFNPHGGVADIQSKGLLAGAELLQQDPAEWFQKFVRPMYDKMGLKKQADRDNYNVKLFGRTGGMLYSQIDRNSGTLANSVDAVRKQKGINSAYDTLMNTFDGKKQAAAASWQKILTNVGEHLLPIVNRGMDAFNKILGGVESFTKNNPGLVKAIAVAMALFAALLVVGGVIAVVVGTFVTLAGIIGGAFTAAIAGAIVIIPVVAGLIIGFWDDIKSGFSAFASAVVGLVSGMWAKVKSYLPSWLGGGGAPLIEKGQATKADQAYYAAAKGGGAPLVDMDQATQADRNYYAAAKGGNTIKTGADRPVKVDANLYLTKSGLQHIANGTGEHLARGASMPLGSGMFDTGLTQTVPGLN
jgi:hypothetical protein